MRNTGVRYEVVRVANIKATDKSEAVFFEVHELHEVDGKEARHRNVDLAFNTEDEAQDWIAKQSQ